MVFQPGKSGNPGGRHKTFIGLAAEVRARTNNGRDLVDFAEKVFRDENLALQMRWAALEWLADRGFGKAAQIIEIANTPSPVDLSRLTSAQLAEFERLLAAAAGETVIDVLPDGSHRP